MQVQVKKGARGFFKRYAYVFRSVEVKERESSFVCTGLVLFLI